MEAQRPAFSREEQGRPRASEPEETLMWLSHVTFVVGGHEMNITIDAPLGWHCVLLDGNGSQHRAPTIVGGQTPSLRPPLRLLGLSVSFGLENLKKSTSSAIDVFSRSHYPRSGHAADEASASSDLTSLRHPPPSARLNLFCSSS